MSDTQNVILLIERARAYGRGFLRGIARYACVHGPWLFHTEPEFYRFHRQRPNEWMRRLSADGVIAHLADVRVIEGITNLGIPAVIAGIREPATNAHVIVTRDEVIGRMAVDYFRDRGFLRLAYCGLDEMYWSKRRGESFCREAAQVGCWVSVYEQPRNKSLCREETERPILVDWLRSLPKPIALLACNDDRSKQILAACETARLKVPDEIAILGVDNDELVCELGYPQLSSIALSVEAAGHAAATLLGKLMAGQEIPAAEKRIEVAPLYVVERQSTDILATEDRDVAAALRFIRAHAKEAIQVRDVTEAISLSRRALQQRFRRVLGRSVHDEIKRTRIDHMARLLVTTNLPITTIAALLQCTEVKNIARYFRQRTGQTPSQYRKTYSAR